MEMGEHAIMGFESLKLFVLYLGLSLVMLALFVRLYIWSTPYHEPTEIAKGKSEFTRRRFRIKKED